MIKVEEKQYRIRETTSTNGAKTYWPEKSIDGKNWIPTHSFSFTGQPFYANSYREALKCIKHDKEGDNEIIHSDPLENVEETQSSDGTELKKEDCCGSIVWLIVWNVLLSLGVILSLCIGIK